MPTDEGDTAPSNRSSCEEEQERLESVAFTCRLTAGYRCVETRLSPDPIINDPLACCLAGPKGMQLAEADWKQLQAAQGPGKHYRVAARSRIIDDALLDALSASRNDTAQGITQVVCIGAGMDTRPWRLPFGQQITYFEVDQEDVIQLKLQLLRQAGAQVSAIPPTDCRFPLMCTAWKPVAIDLKVNNLQRMLLDQGFDPAARTAWIAEGLLYYLQLAEAEQLLKTLEHLSSPGSCLLATCIDTELLESHRKLVDHAFANLWNFCMDDMRGPLNEGGANKLLSTNWVITREPETTKVLALRQYGKETYVPVSYGGHENFFQASV